MCGIYGAVEFNPIRDADTRLLSAMSKVMTHRGPDSGGAYVGPGIALGMRRLSIIDLEGGHQPIANEDETVWVVCNGEIYNFRELRAFLLEKGHRFRCGSDAEVLVHLYEEEGPDCVRRLRGMFGYAVWDVTRRRLILGRDRLGKKPLYYRVEPQRLLFASELKALLEDASIPRQIDPVALREYLSLGFVPAPLCLVQGVQKLLPGHYLIIENGTVEDREYWDVNYTNVVEGLSEGEWVEQVREKLLESVRIRMISDVPLGAFLSGGIDSSAIVAAMARSSSYPVNTYSIGFEGEDSFYNELPYARRVADMYGTNHHEIIVRPDVGSLLPKLVWHLDEPIADSASLTTYLVSEMARETVKVILSGVGGDELFGGYRRYLGSEVFRYYRVVPEMFRVLFRNMLARLPQDRHSSFANYVRYASAFARTAELEPDVRYMSYVALFSPEWRKALQRDDLSLTDVGSSEELQSHILAQYFAHAPATDDLNRLMYVDIKTSLPDDLLALTDRMTMASSIECRAPFMDHELVELTAQMPTKLKTHGFTLKYLLKQAVHPWLPQEIIHRKKRGFGAPIGAWLRSSLDELVLSTLNEGQVKRRGLFTWSSVERLLELHNSRESDNTDQLLALINLELWCRLFLDGEDKQFHTIGPQ